MIRKIPILLVCLSGCAPYLDAQSALVAQTRKGIDMLKTSLDQKSQIVRAYHESKRTELDDSFDRDVRERTALTPEWVIEHRRAYSRALEILAAARVASLESDESDRRTIDAIRAALDRLEWLQSLQLRITMGSR